MISALDEGCIGINVSSKMRIGPHQRHAELSPVVASLDARFSGGFFLEFLD
jgi:hypothetical protein